MSTDYLLEQREHLSWLFTITEAVLSDIGQPLHDATVLDFGCGEGATVNAFLDAGHDAYGCDIVTTPSDRLRLIETPYRIPYDDETFDVVVSNQVFEHVQNQWAAFKELARVTKPGGWGLHFFPPRWQPIEEHTNIPLGNVLRPYWWLRMWATLGVRNDFQQGLPSGRVAFLNERFLRDETKYVPRRALLRTCRDSFYGAGFIEGIYLRNTTTRARRIAHIPGGPRVYSAFRGRVLLLHR